jgi:multidrug efflux pump subunit AcrA (membrane-fusion protein)
MDATSTDTASLADRLSGRLSRLDALSGDGLSLVEFFEAFGREMMDAVGGSAVATWMIDRQQALGLLTDVGLSASGLLDDLKATRLNQRLLIDAIQTGRTETKDFTVASSLECDAALFLPLRRGERRIGVVQVFGRRDNLRVETDGDRQSLSLAISAAERFLDWLEESATAKDPSKLLPFFTTLARELHRSLDPEAVAMAAVNELRRTFLADRVSILERIGSRLVLTAISGQQRINPRSNQVQALMRLTEHALRIDGRFVFDGRPDRIPAAIQPVLAEYIESSGARMLLIEPLRAPTEPIADGEPAADCTSPALGALVFEQFQDSQPRPSLTEHLPLLAGQVALAVRNAGRHERLLLIPGIRTIGHALGWFRGRRLAATIFVMVLVTGAIAGAFLWPCRLRMEGRGQLMPAIQRRVFAPLEGEVIEILVRSGDRVQKGQLLVRLSNPAMQSQLLTLQGRQLEALKAVQSLRVELRNADQSRQREQSLRLQSQIEQQTIELGGAAKQIEVLKGELAGLNVLAPIDGTVATFGVEQQLAGRPVSRGDALLELMDESGPWRLELDLAEHRVGHVLDALKERQRLPVTFRLAARPDETFRGDLRTVDDRTTTTPAGESVVQVLVDVDRRQVSHRRIGADVIAKIECVPSNLAYCWFGEVVEFVQRRWWY